MSEGNEFLDSLAVSEDVVNARSKVEAFVSQACAQGQRIAVVTGGGTRVNLEKNTVRFIDNFSSGGRAAACTEHLLHAGYSVIFLHRKGCVAPFARHIARVACGGGDPAGASFDLKLVTNGLKIGKGEDGNEQIQFVGASPDAISAVGNAHRFQQQLLSVPFVTLTEYLHLLRTCCVATQPAGTSSVIMLAAAVSDFYVPDAAMAEHKIQSREGPLELTLQQTPKMLGMLRSDWCPKALCISFKLETDEAILMSKARAAIDKYGMHMVVANTLQTRMQRVVLVTPVGQEGTGGETPVEAPVDGRELETLIIDAVVRAHDAHRK